MDRKSILNKCMDYISHENLSKLDYIFEYDKVNIAKQFIKDTMGLNPAIMSFNDIRKSVCYIVKHKKIEFPYEEIDFYNTIFNNLMFLKSEPKVEYETLNNKINSLYKKIDSIKKLIEAKETQIHNQKKESSNNFEQLRLRRNKLRNKCKSYSKELKQMEIIAIETFPKLDYQGRKCAHYKKLLEDELQEIQSVDIKIRALSICSYITSDNDNYKYYISPLEDSEDIFLPDCDYSISVKFAKELSEFIAKFHNNNSEFDEAKFKEASSKYPYHSNAIEDLRDKSITEYIDFLSNYIKEKNVYEYTIENIKNNHVLSKRYEILKLALNCYRNEQYLSFINIAIIEIEGIFYDFCFQIGIHPKEMNSFGLNTKLNILNDKQVFNAHEYFAFDFPLIRNKVAHGLMTDEINKIEIEKIAHETLLDLQYLVYVFQTNKKLPYYAPLKFVKVYKNANNNIYDYYAKLSNSDPKNECLYTHLKYHKYNITPHDPFNNLQWILNPIYNEIYNFYKISNEHEEIKNHLLSCDFLDFIRQKIERYLKSIRISIHDDEIIDELKTWRQLFQSIICYCNDNNISNDVAYKVISLKKSVENNISKINNII